MHLEKAQFQRVIEMAFHEGFRMRHEAKSELDIHNVNEHAYNYAKQIRVIFENKNLDINPYSTKISKRRKK